MRLLANIFILLVIVDAGASGLAAFYLFQLGDKLGRYLGWAWLAVSVNAVVIVLTLGMIQYQVPVPVFGAALWLRFFSQLFKTVTVGAVTLRLLGYLNGYKRKTPPEEPKQ
jgi:hypothetical protein